MQLLFLLLAPAIGYPLESPRNIDMVQIITPVFLGYLGSASYFVFAGQKLHGRVRNEFLGYLTVGPIIIYVVAVSAAFFSFGWTNRPSAQPGSGVSVENLGNALSLSLGVLAMTTSVVASYLFAAVDGPGVPKK